MCREEPPPTTTCVPLPGQVPLPPPHPLLGVQVLTLHFQTGPCDCEGTLEEFSFYEGKPRLSQNHVNVGIEAMRKVLLHGDLQWDNRSRLCPPTLMDTAGVAVLWPSQKRHQGLLAAVCGVGRV